MSSGVAIVPGVRYKHLQQAPGNCLDRGMSAGLRQISLNVGHRSPSIADYGGRILYFCHNDTALSLSQSGIFILTRHQ